jgi:hypothetical protein
MRVVNFILSVYAIFAINLCLILTLKLHGVREEYRELYLSRLTTKACVEHMNSDIPFMKTIFKPAVVAACHISGVIE